MILTTVYHTDELGDLTVAADDAGVVGLWLDGQKYFEDTLEGVDASEEVRPAKPGESAILDKATAWLDRYFAGEPVEIGDLPLAPRGSDFRKRVWHQLALIPYGKLTSYGAIAQTLSAEDGKHHSARAVGGAVGRNPISIIVPCHRVVGASGSLTGYAGGIKRKIWLLNHEGVDTSKLSVPTKGTAL